MVPRLADNCNSTLLSQALPTKFVHLHEAKLLVVDCVKRPMSIQRHSQGYGMQNRQRPIVIPRISISAIRPCNHRMAVAVSNTFILSQSIEDGSQVYQYRSNSPSIEYVIDLDRLPGVAKNMGIL